MLASIASFPLANGSLSGGFGLSDFRMRVVRVFDVVAPLGQADPVPIDRTVRKFDLTFTVKRMHSNIKASEQYIQDHEATVPQSGTVTLISNSGATWFLLNGVLISHELITEIGATTYHSYHIVGGPLNFGSAAYHITAQRGLFTLTGEPAILSTSRSMSAAHGSFTLTGEPVLFNVTFPLSADHGTFTLTGEPVTLTVGFPPLSAGFGAFVLTGEPVTLTLGTPALSAGFGSFVLTGEPVDLRGDSILMETGDYILTETSDYILME
jgi:hypothetical protein